MTYAKLDDTILDSTLWMDADARIVFLTALLMAAPHEVTEPTPQLAVRTLDETGFLVPPGWYGRVRAAGIGIVNKAMLGENARTRGLDALERLGAPDYESRSSVFDGRRLVRIDGGFLILNFMHYRDYDHTHKDRQRRYRERTKDARTPAPKSSAAPKTEPSGRDEGLPRRDTPQDSHDPETPDIAERDASRDVTVTSQSASDASRDVTNEPVTPSRDAVVVEVLVPVRTTTATTTAVKPANAPADADAIAGKKPKRARAPKSGRPPTNRKTLAPGPVDDVPDYVDIAEWIPPPQPGDDGVALAASEDPELASWPEAGGLRRDHPRILARRVCHANPSRPPLIPGDPRAQLDVLFERWRYRVGTIDYGRWYGAVKENLAIEGFVKLWNAIEAFHEARNFTDERAQRFLSFSTWLESLPTYVAWGMMPMTDTAGRPTERARRFTR